MVMVILSIWLFIMGFLVLEGIYNLFMSIYTEDKNNKRWKNTRVYLSLAFIIALIGLIVTLIVT